MNATSTTASTSTGPGLAKVAPLPALVRAYLHHSADVEGVVAKHGGGIVRSYSRKTGMVRLLITAGDAREKAFGMLVHLGFEARDSADGVFVEVFGYYGRAIPEPVAPAPAATETASAPGTVAKVAAVVVALPGATVADVANDVAAMDVPRRAAMPMDAGEASGGRVGPPRVAAVGGKGCAATSRRGRRKMNTTTQDDAAPATDVRIACGVQEWQTSRPEPRRRLSEVTTEELLAELSRRGVDAG